MISKLTGRPLDTVVFPAPFRCGRASLAVCAAFLSALAGTGWAADSPAPAPAAAISAAKPEQPVSTSPTRAMAAMIASLDKDGDFVVAVAAGQSITKRDVADVIRAMPVGLASLGYKALFTRAMDQLLRQGLGAASARTAGIDKDPAVLHREKSAEDRVLAEAWVDRQADAAVTENSLHALYDREIAGKPGPEEVRAQVILVPLEVQARDLIGKILGGADFAELARRYSKDLSAPNGGDIGYVPLDGVGAEVGSVMFALAPGQVTQFPVRALPGYFIVRVEGRRQRATPTFEEARPALTSELRQEAAAAALRALTSDIRVKDNQAGGAVTGSQPASR